MGMPTLIDLAGQVFGFLEVTARAENTKQGSAQWFCKCLACGNMCRRKGGDLRNGNSTHCGCQLPERCRVHATVHGHAGKVDSPTYRSWHGMMMRGAGHKPEHYLGVVVCQRWRTFVNFLEDLGERPSLSHSIDRFPDCRGHYSCGTCEECLANGWSRNARWATPRQQAQNMTTNRLVTFGDETYCIAEWARIKGMSKQVLRHRLNSGWTIEQALTIPVGKYPGRMPRPADQ